jgi:hypothetical protein
MNVVFVAGTFGLRGGDAVVNWWRPESAFADVIRSMGHTVLGLPPMRPFEWTTNVDWFEGSDLLLDWRVGGVNLYEYCVPSVAPDRRVPPDQLTVVAHSHGLQVVLFAAAAGLKIDHLVSICSPIRQDMMKTGRFAKVNIAKWTHLYSDDTDWWQALGELGDGGLGVTRDCALADDNVFFPGVGHAGLLTPAKYDIWRAHPGWLGA